MEKYLLIFDNVDSYNKNNSDTAKAINQLFNTYNDREDFCFYVFRDSTDIDTLKSILQDDDVDLSKDEFYIILHYSAINNNSGISEQECEELFSNYQIKVQMHEPEQFYYTKMPLLIKENNISFSEVIDGYFKTDQELKKQEDLNAKVTIFHKLLEGLILSDKESALINFNKDESLIDVRERLFS